MSLLTELKTELERVEALDELLDALYNHHRSQANGAGVVSMNWHRELALRIDRLRRKERRAYEGKR